MWGGTHIVCPSVQAQRAPVAERDVWWVRGTREQQASQAQAGPGSAHVLAGTDLAGQPLLSGVLQVSSKQCLCLASLCSERTCSGLTAGWWCHCTHQAQNCALQLRGSSVGSVTQGRGKQGRVFEIRATTWTWQHYREVSSVVRVVVVVLGYGLASMG